MRRVRVTGPHSEPGSFDALAARPVAVVVMAKWPLAGHVKTRLSPPLTPRQAAQLARDFLLDKLEQVRRLRGVGRFLAFAPPEAEAFFTRLARPDFVAVSQLGTGLGERLAGLVERVTAGGLSGVIIVGTDSPTLPDAYLVEAIRVLKRQTADVVIGPSDDGGYYLIGMQRPAPSVFHDIPWGTSAVFQETVARIRDAALRSHVLPTWFDVDAAPDLRRLARDLERREATARHTRARLRTLHLSPGPG